MSLDELALAPSDASVSNLDAVVLVCLVRDLERPKPFYTPPYGPMGA